jgi:magnesium transporter
MIQGFVLKDANLVHVDPSAIEKAVWLDLVNPNEEEIHRFSEMFSINPEDFVDCLDPDERPRFESEEGYFLLMLRIPVTSKKLVSTAYPTCPVGFFVMPDRLLTVHSDALDLVEYFRQRRTRRPTEDSMDLLVDLLRSARRRFDKLIREIQNRLWDFRKAIAKSVRTVALEESYDLSNDLVFLNASVLGNSNAIGHMMRQKSTSFRQEVRGELEDIEIDTMQHYEVTALYRELLSSSLDTYSSAISNNLNLVMKILASISLILMLPTLIASLYGMNVQLPLAGTPYAFYVILLISVAWSAFLWLLFRRLKWL